ncbi:MAG TPA: hypothetical protein VGG19_18220 [Tepidisphaeraceae bacterium]
MKTALAFLLCFCVFAHGETISFSVKPSTTDPLIKTFDTPSWVYINRDIVIGHDKKLPADRHQLLLWLVGTGGFGHSAQGFANLAADLGYHVITLMYPDNVPAALCAHDDDPESFEKFRMALIEGGHATYQCGQKEISIDRPESIENRTIKLLLFLQKQRPMEDWGQFLDADGKIKWDAVAIAGHSQGAGHAALIGIKHRVARVICFGGPKDFSKKLDAPAAWYSEQSDTPKERFFVFNHHQDPKGCTPAELLLNLKALGLNETGPTAEVDQDHFPFHHAHVLFTNYPKVTVDGPNSDGARIAHSSVINTNNAKRWKEVWTYMLTAPEKKAATQPLGK